jgi:hypothetical protein
MEVRERQDLAIEGAGAAGRRGEGRSGARKSWGMLAQEYTVVKGKLAMETKRLMRVGLSGMSRAEVRG